MPAFAIDPAARLAPFAPSDTQEARAIDVHAASGGRVPDLVRQFPEIQGIT